MTNKRNIKVSKLNWLVLNSSRYCVKKAMFYTFQKIAFSYKFKALPIIITF